MSRILAGGEPFFFPAGDIGCLLTHGFTATPQEMRGLGEHLASQSYTVLGVRLSGHGTSVKDMSRTRWHDWVASVEDGYHMLNDMCTHPACDKARGVEQSKDHWTPIGGSTILLFLRAVLGVLRLLGFQCLVHGIGGALIHAGQEMAVQIDRDLDARVSKHFRYDLGVYVLLQQDRRCCVPQVVKPHPFKAGLLRYYSKVMAQHGRVAGFTCEAGNEAIQRQGLTC